MEKKQFRFSATVSDRGQIFIPKALQDYFHIHARDKVMFVVDTKGNVTFLKNERGNR
jgi:AbrB family looped-hinge helix DNA binding protein